MPTAIVTGASRGLGQALSAALLDRGWTVVVDARGQADLDAAGLSGRAGAVIAIAGDICDAAHRQALLDAAVDAGDLALVVNNASRLGPSPLPTLADHPLDELTDIYRTNVVAPLAVIQLALPALRAGAGAVLNVSSDAAVEAYEGWGGYGSSKAALEHASAVLGVEEPAVRVWWVDPGDMRTAMHQAAFPDDDISDRPLPETRVPGLLRLIDEQLPSGRYRAESLLQGAASAVAR
jgi:NAD(P)-dependent dehydrogenase (short-subunit alcohol dehydrogenase family)